MKWRQMIAILTDSTSDLPPQTAQQLNIEVLPLHVRMGQRELLDWQEVDPDAVYRFMRSGGRASTRPASVQDFERKYIELLKTNHQVLSIHISAKLSDTVKHASEARRRMPEPDRILVVDSQLAAAPLAEVVLAARKAANAGKTLVEVARMAQVTRSEMFSEFSVESLEYLRRSGRIGRTAEVMGNLLNIRPVLRFQQGEFQVERRSRSAQVILEMLAQLEQHFGKEPLNVAVAHAGRDIARISALQQTVQGSRLNIKARRTFLLGSVIGAHVGPGTFGLLAHPYLG